MQNYYTLVGTTVYTFYAKLYADKMTILSNKNKIVNLNVNC